MIPNKPKKHKCALNFPQPYSTILQEGKKSFSTKILLQAQKNLAENVSKLLQQVIIVSNLGKLVKGFTTKRGYII